MKWQRVSDYAIRAGDFWIAKFHIADRVRFIAWDNNTQLGVFDDANAAKRLVRSMAGRDASPEAVRKIGKPQ